MVDSSKFFNINTQFSSDQMFNTVSEIIDLVIIYSFDYSSSCHAILHSKKFVTIPSPHNMRLVTSSHRTLSIQYLQYSLTFQTDAMTTTVHGFM